MALDVTAIIFFFSGMFLIVRWIHAAIRSRMRAPAAETTFTTAAMWDRRLRRRSGLYLGSGLLCIGVGLFLSGMALQL